MAQTLIEKIAQRYAVALAPGQLVKSGDFITIRPKHVMTHDNTGAVIPKFNEMTKGTIPSPTSHIPHRRPPPARLRHRPRHPEQNPRKPRQVRQNREVRGRPWHRLLPR